MSARSLHGDDGVSVVAKLDDRGYQESLMDLMGGRAQDHDGLVKAQAMM
jgi:hypothetical protein